MLINTPLDEEESKLLHYFSNELGWGYSKLSSKLSFNFLIDAKRFVGKGSVLDVGAGSKRFAPFFKDARYYSLEHLGGIKQKNMEKYKYDYICELDEENFPVEKNFKLLYCHSVLEHIFDVKQFLSNMFKILESGGRLYINVPFVYYEHEVPNDYCRYTRYGLRRFITQAGFDIVSLTPNSNAFEGAGSFLVMAVKHEIEQRGESHRNYGPLKQLEKIINELNLKFSDHLYDSLIPLGFLVIATKP